MSVEIRKETITPELAKIYLEKNIGNRKPIARSINKYARDMVACKWTETGDTIKFDMTGTLIDGQNRLFAVILANKSCKFFVARGLSPEAKMSTDIGAPRTVNHILEFMGEKNVAALAATARLCLAHSRGVLGNTTAHSTFSVREIADFVEEDSLVRACVQATAGMSNLRNTFNPSSLSFVMYATYRISPELSAQFFDLLDVPPQDKLHPCYVVNQSIHTLRRNTRRGSSISSMLILALLIKAWNAFILDKKVSHFKWGEMDGFPKILKPNK